MEHKESEWSIPIKVTKSDNYRISDINDFLIAKVFHKTTADIFVKAVNNHYKLVKILKDASKKPEEIQALMRKHGLKFESIDDPMTKLGFSIYTDLVSIAEECRQALKDVEEKC